MSHTLILRFARYNRRKIYREHLYFAPAFEFENLPNDSEPQMKESKLNKILLKILIGIIAIVVYMFFLTITNN